jgi:hypothetical protein
MALWYMHTIDGRPAYFSEREGQIVFAEDHSRWEDESDACHLRSSLKEIERDQRRTDANRKKWGFVSKLSRGYVIVSDVPTRLTREHETL